MPDDSQAIKQIHNLTIKLPGIRKQLEPLYTMQKEDGDPLV